MATLPGKQTGPHLIEFRLSIQWRHASTVNLPLAACFLQRRFEFLDTSPKAVLWLGWHRGLVRRYSPPLINHTRCDFER